MKDKIANITRWILYVLLFIGAVAGVLFYTHALGSWGGTSGGSGTGSSALIYLGYIFFYLSIVVLIVAPVYTIVKNPKNMGKMLVSVGVLIVILAISYGVAGNYMTPQQLAAAGGGKGITAEGSRLVGAGLYAIYITLALAVVSIFYSAIIKIFK